MHDMCVNSCIAYTGPLEKLESCPQCYEPRYQPTPECNEDNDDQDEEIEHVKVPHQQFSTLPLGPQLQALWAQEKVLKICVIGKDILVKYGRNYI